MTQKISGTCKTLANRNFLGFTATSPLTCLYGNDASIGTQNGGPSFAVWVPLTGTCTFSGTQYSEANQLQCTENQSACQVTCVI